MEMMKQKIVQMIQNIEQKNKECSDLLVEN